MIDASIYRSWSHRLALPLIIISSILLPHAAYMYARSSSHREASATEEAEAAQGCNIIILLSVPIFVCVFIQSAEQHLYIGLSLCSQQRSPPKQEIATREVTLPNTAASHQGRGEGNKQQMATTVPAIQSNEELKDVLRKAKEPNSKLVFIYSFS
jgi:hypothetical protein